MIDPENYDWTRFEIVQYYNASPGDLFRAWATGAGLESFFIESVIFRTKEGELRKSDQTVAAGDQYEWKWRHDAGLSGEILRVEPDHEVAISFGGMEVSVSLTACQEQTELHLVQTGIPDNESGRVLGHLNCRSSRMAANFVMRNPTGFHRLRSDSNHSPS